MKKLVKWIVIFIVAVLILVIAGAILFFGGLWTVGETLKEEFKTSVSTVVARVMDKNGFPKLEVEVYATAGDINIYLNDPNRNQIDWAYITDSEMRDGKETKWLGMAGYCKTPVKGTYTLLMEDMLNHTLYSREFAFNGANIAITDAIPSFEYYEYLGYYALENVNIAVENTGDLLAYIHDMDVVIGDSEGTVYFKALYTPLIPNQHKELIGSCYISEIPLGSQEMSLTLKDSDGTSIAIYSKIINPSEYA